MIKIISEDFEKYRKIIKENLPTWSSDFEHVNLYFHPNGGEYCNGELMLIDNECFDKPLYRVASGHGIKESDIDKYYARDFARIMFLDRVSKALTHDAIASHFEKLIRLAHNDVRINHLDDRIEIVYQSLHIIPRSSVFTVSPDSIKFVVLKDHVVFESISISHFERNVTYYSKDSNGHVVNRSGIVGELSYEPAFSHSTKLYGTAFGVSLNSIVEIVDNLGDEEKSMAFRLRRELLGIPLSDGKMYENALNNLLHYIFSNCYEEVEMHVQVANKGRLRIRDIVIDNRDPKNNFLSLLKDNGVHYLLIEAKNYKAPLSPNDIDTFINYITENKRFGRFGIVISRMGASENLMEQQLRKLGENIEIVVLKEEDVLEMIDLRALDRDPMSVIKNRLRQLHFQQ